MDLEIEADPESKRQSSLSKSVQPMLNKGSAEVLYLVSVCLAFLALVTTSLLQFFNWSTIGFSLGVFNHKSDELWEKQNKCLIETSWIFYMWAAVYIIQVPWLLYGVTLICRKTNTGNYLYIRPPVMPSSMYIMFFGSLISTMIWVFLRDQEPVTRIVGKPNNIFARIAIIAILLTVIFSYMAFSISIYKISLYENEMISKKLQKDSWFIRIVVHNGVGSHATWTSLLLFYNIALVLREEANVDSFTGCYITIGLTLFFVIIFFVIDLILIVRVRCFLILPYILIVVCQCATILKNLGAKESAALSLAGGLVGITFVLFIVKIVFFIVTIRKVKPEKDEMIKPTPPEDSPPPTPSLLRRPTPLSRARPSPLRPTPLFR